MASWTVESHIPDVSRTRALLHDVDRDHSRECKQCILNSFWIGIRIQSDRGVFSAKPIAQCKGAARQRASDPLNFIDIVAIDDRYDLHFAIALHLTVDEEIVRQQAITLKRLY